MHVILCIPDNNQTVSVIDITWNEFSVFSQMNSAYFPTKQQHIYGVISVDDSK